MGSLNMTKRHPLWDELEKRKALLEEQEGRVYQQCKLLVEAVMAGQITDWPEVEDLLFELIEFGDYYISAWELCAQLRRYIGKHFSPYVQMGGNFTRILIEDAEQGEETL